MSGGVQLLVGDDLEFFRKRAEMQSLGSHGCVPFEKFERTLGLRDGEGSQQQTHKTLNGCRE